MITVKSLSYQYQAAKKIVFPDVELAKGEHCLLLGESGSGKTTLMHLLGGLRRIQEGAVTINNTALNALSEFERDRFRGQKIGFVFQRHHLISALTVKENLMLAPWLAKVDKDEKGVHDVMTSLGLNELKSKSVKHLSQGQMQRVAIARAVLNRPEVILADEPTSSLDDTNCQRVIDLLLKASASCQATLLIATHDNRLKTIFQKQITLQPQA